MTDIKIGEFQKFNYPKDKAICLMLSNHQKSNTFYCPSCQKKSEFKQNHGDAYQCGNCGLKRQSFGNALYTWEDSFNSIKYLRKAKLEKIMRNLNGKRY